MKIFMGKVLKRGYIVSFILTAVTFLLVLFSQHIIGGGNSNILRSDLFAQYVPYITNFWRCVRGESSFWYSFSNYLGQGNILNIAYYCINPFNVLLLVDFWDIEVSVLILILLKISLSSALFEFFAEADLKCSKLYAVVASLFYGLSGYAVIIHYNIMWLDVIYMLPLLIHLIIKFIKKGNYLGLIFAYIYIFITNFYMSYIVGVFTALFYIVYTLYVHDYKLKGNIKKILIKSAKFAGVVILAAGVCAIVLLSTVGFLSCHVAEDNRAFEEIGLSLLDLFNSLFMGQMVTYNNVAPFMYCGLPVTVLAIFFFVSNKISIKEKISAGIIMVFYIASFFSKELYAFQHAFDYPNFYACRFSFIVIFMMVSLAAIAAERLTKDDFSFFKKYAIIAIIFYSFMIGYQAKTLSTGTANDQNGLLINAAFLAAWLITLFFVLYKDSRTKKIFKAIIIGLTLLEVGVNGYLCFSKMDMPNLKDNEFNGWYYSEKEAIEDIKANDDSFYRVYVNNEWGINAATIFGYNSTISFSSSDNYELRKALSALGSATTNRALQAHSLVPGFDNLFGVKYYIGLPDIEDYDVNTYTKDNHAAATVSQNDMALSLGYMVREDILDYQLETNCFNNIERLCNDMTGLDKDIYSSIPNMNVETINLGYFENAGGIVYYPQASAAEVAAMQFTVSGNYPNAYAYYYMFDPGAFGNSPLVTCVEVGYMDATYMTMGGAYKCEYLPDYDVYRTGIVCEGDISMNGRIDGLYFASYNEDEFVDVFNELSKNQLEIYENTGDRITGRVTATADKNVLFTSIPYDPEWIVYVDGAPATIYRVVGDAFISLKLEPGEHDVTFVYVEKYSMYGAIASFVSIVILCGLVILNLFSKKAKGSND